MKAQYFMSLNIRGEVSLIVEASPPHELLENQVALSEDEFLVLKALKGDLKALHRAIHSLEKKLKRYREGQ